MSSCPERKIYAFSAGGTITKGLAVKFSGTNVVAAAATTDNSIGLAQTDAASGEQVEVAMPGGGGFAIAQGTIAAGDRLVSHTDGKLKKAAAANDIIIAQALESAVAGDIFAVQVVFAQATNAQT